MTTEIFDYLRYCKECGFHKIQEIIENKSIISTRGKSYDLILMKCEKGHTNVHTIKHCLCDICCPAEYKKRINKILNINEEEQIFTDI